MAAETIKNTRLNMAGKRRVWVGEGRDPDSHKKIGV
jgi:hypothetical protein